MNDTKPYVKRDFKILLVLIVLMGILITALWYFESTQGIFTKLAEQFLAFD